MPITSPAFLTLWGLNPFQRLNVCATPMLFPYPATLTPLPSLLLPPAQGRVSASQAELLGQVAVMHRGPNVRAARQKLIQVMINHRYEPLWT